MVAVVGPSGSGKTTLFRCVTQLERATRGSIKIGGEVLCEDSPDGSVYVDKQKRHELLLKMGLVFQSFNLFPHYNVLKNIINAPMDVPGKSRQEAEEIARRLLETGVLRQGSLSKAARGYHLAQGNDARPVQPFGVLQVAPKASVEQGLEASLENALAQQHITFEEYVEARDDNSGVPKDKFRAILDRRRGAAPEQSEMRPNGSKGRGGNGSRVWEKRKAPAFAGLITSLRRPTFLALRK